jgi:hemolysin III
VALGIGGAVWLGFVISRLPNAGDRVATAVYAVGLVAMLTASAAYNMWPPTPVRSWLRRIDHSAIYIMIAATYSPFMAQIRDDWTAGILLGAVWSVAIAGVILKFAMPHRFHGLSIALYLALGWSGVAAYDALGQVLDRETWWLLGAGGVIYSAGVVFHLAEALPFHNAIWHLFVLTAAGLHYVAVLGLF